MTVHLTPLQEQRLQHLAQKTELTPDELAQDCIDRFLAYQEEMLEAVKRGDDDIAAKRLVEHADVVQRIDYLLQGR